MNANRPAARIARHAAEPTALAIAFALLIPLVMAALFVTQPARAYADLTGAQLVAQGDAQLLTQDETGSTEVTQLTTAMLEFIDQNPSESGSKGVKVALKNGDAALTASTDYSTSSSGQADNDHADGKTTTITGNGNYAGKLVVNYKTTVTGADVAANFVQVRYNATDGFKVVAGPAARGATLTFPNASKSLSGELTVTGTGSYAGQTIKVEYSIERKIVVREEMIAIGIKPDGKSLDVVVTDGKNTLKKDTDYTLADLTPEGADGAGEPFHVKIDGIGSCECSYEKYYVIEGDGGEYSLVEKKYLPDCTIELVEKTFPYTGQTQKPSGVIAKDGTTPLKKDTDYTIEFENENSKALGTYKVKVTGKGGYRGKVELEYSIEKVADSEDLRIELADAHKEYTYSGRAQKPTFNAYESTTYSHVMATITKEAPVESTDPADPGADPADPEPAPAPAPEVVKETKYLTEGTDYEMEISPSGTTDAGTYTITVRGKGDYADKGIAQATFTIKPAKLTTSSVSYASYNSYPSSYYYTGAEIKPTLSYVYSSTTSGYLTEGVDYTVSEYVNNKNVASSSDENPPTIVLKGMGNYTDEEYKYFSIIACPLTSTYVTVEYDAVTFTGKALTPKPKSVKVTASNVNLKEGVDYEVATDSYSSNVNAGTASGNIVAKGKNFSGSMTANFTINPKAITSGDISVSGIAPQDYTGSVITPAVEVKDSGAGATLKQGTLSTYYTYDSETGGYKPFQQLDSESDCYLEYSDNKNPGTATVKVVGGNNYTGERSVQFTINGTGTVPKVTASDEGDGQVTLSWNLIYNATKYRVQEKKPDGKLKTLSDEWTSTKCRITNLSTTRDHTFLVSAFVDGAWSATNPVSIKPTGASKPTVRGFSTGKKSIQLSWNAVPGADRYAIYQKIGGKFRALTKSYTYTVANINKLKKKGKYTYYVRANVDGKWTKVKKADYVTVSPSDPNPPEVKTEGAGTGAIKLSWAKPLNAKKYMVEMQLANGKWKVLKKNLKQTSYTATGLTSSSAYVFRVRAYGNKKWTKPYSDLNVTATAP